MIDFHPAPFRCDRCRALAWEAIDTCTVRERGRGVLHDVIECVFCGVRKVVEALPKPAVTARQHRDHAEFRFAFGRFAGMTMAEADGEENGRAYLEHMAATNEKLRDRIAAHLEKNPLDSSGTGEDIVPPSELSGAMDCPERVPSSQRLFG